VASGHWTLSRPGARIVAFALIRRVIAGRVRYGHR
jgi:hypothetical protein